MDSRPKRAIKYAFGGFTSYSNIPCPVSYDEYAVFRFNPLRSVPAPPRCPRSNHIVAQSNLLARSLARLRPHFGPPFSDDSPLIRTVASRKNFARARRPAAAGKQPDATRGGTHFRATAKRGGNWNESSVATRARKRCARLTTYIIIK